ncbi:MAG TPA: 3-isopropylmalate dehydratase large subunit, partial [Anaerolineae bacterium]|nr:3-isopropylmalate dehydratase large subunit [Anaerolineae bacterium]
MGQTIAEKILAAHTSDEVAPGKLAEVQVDMVLANDITAPISIREFAKLGVEKVFDRSKVALVP